MSQLEPRACLSPFCVSLSSLKNHFLEPCSISLEKRFLQLMYVLGAQPLAWSCVLLGRVGVASVTAHSAAVSTGLGPGGAAGGGHVWRWFAVRWGLCTADCGPWRGGLCAPHALHSLVWGPALLRKYSALTNPWLRCVSKQVRLLLRDVTLKWFPT